LTKGDFILGDSVYELESQLSEYVGVGNCISCASGTDALVILLMAYGIKEGDAVFTTNFSFFATIEAISIVGATPILVDIDKDTFNISSQQLESKIKNVIKNNKLIPKCIMPVDLFGQLADYENIDKIASKYNLIVIEDAAQSFGATSHNKKSCSFGHSAATSFYPAKPLGCYGDGGAIFTNDDNIAQICQSIRVHGQGKDKYDNIRIGLNSRLDTIQATVLLNKLKVFDDELSLRNNIATKYQNKLSDYVKVPHISIGSICSWAQYSILVQNGSIRTEIIDFLNEKNIPTAIFYKVPFSENGIYKNDNNSNEFNVSKNISERIFSIPMHPYLSDDEIEYISESIISYFKK
tara:strand:+ start:426 stop:1478 length:1053 start_codon:yes stop_codon:yes gene_type:complete